MRVKEEVSLSTLVLEKTESGIHLDPEELRKAGFEPGVPMELVQLLDKEAIVCRALSYVIQGLGYALGVRAPLWNGVEWVVEVLGADQVTHLGHVFLDSHGNVLPEKSATFDSVMELANAARAANKTAA